MATKSNISDKDLALVEACKKELPYTITAYEALVRKYEPTVLNTCRYLLVDNEDSEETSQDVFLRVFHHIKKFDQRSTFRTWLYRIVRNCCYTRIKQQQSLAILKREFFVNFDPGLQKPEKEGAMSTKMDEALSKLSPDDREIIVLRYFSDLSIKEISETLEIKISATKMRFYRALEKLKEVLKQ